MPFDRVIGHDRVRELLARALKEGRLPPALLLTGPEGVGKRILAMEVARALLCASAGDNCCESCPPCHRTARGLHPDLVVVEPESGAIKIDRVRELVRGILGRPFEGPARAFIVDEAHLLTEQAANALLKSLEEPPPTSHVFLVTASPQTLLPTVRSRCQTVRLGGLPEHVIEERLKSQFALDAGEARLRAVLSGGSLGAALRFQSEDFRKLRDELLVLLEGTESKRPLDRLEAAERLSEESDLPLALTALRALLRDVAALRAGARVDSLLNADVGARLQGLADGRWGERASSLAEVVGEARETLRGNANKLLAMDALLETFAAALPQTR
jgi:DNA polymerase-3 subunit delta'